MADVVVVIGAGGIGQAIARRVGSGQTVLFADFDERVQEGAVQAFEALGYTGGAGVVISSTAGHMPPPLPPEQNEAIARTPADELLKLPFLQPAAVPDSMVAYSIAKRANTLRLQAESVRWGERSARINSISPGIIGTPLAMHELASPSGPVYRAMIEASSARRMGTPDEVAAAAAFLLGPEGAFVTGSDLLMDGGVIDAMRSGKLKLPGLS